MTWVKRHAVSAPASALLSAAAYLPALRLAASKGDQAVLGCPVCWARRRSKSVLLFGHCDEHRVSDVHSTMPMIDVARLVSVSPQHAYTRLQNIDRAMVTGTLDPQMMSHWGAERQLFGPLTCPVPLLLTCSSRFGEYERETPPSAFMPILWSDLAVKMSRALFLRGVFVTHGDHRLSAQRGMQRNVGRHFPGIVWERVLSELMADDEARSVFASALLVGAKTLDIFALAVELYPQHVRRTRGSSRWKLEPDDHVLWLEGASRGFASGDVEDIAGARGDFYWEGDEGPDEDEPEPEVP